MSIICIIRDVPKEALSEITPIADLESYTITPSESVGRFILNPHFKVEAVPQQHNLFYTAVVSVPDDTDRDNWHRLINLPGHTQ